MSRIGPEANKGGGAVGRQIRVDLTPWAIDALQDTNIGGRLQIIGSDRRALDALIKRRSCILSRGVKKLKYWERAIH